MFLGYNTNGFAHHRLEDAIAILAELGYRGIALTPDVNHLDPFVKSEFGDDDLPFRVGCVRNDLQIHSLECVIETGSRFLLDPRRKHHPTLISPEHDEREYRFGFLIDCLSLAVGVGAKFLSFWSGAATDDASHRILMTHSWNTASGSPISPRPRICGSRSNPSPACSSTRWTSSPNCMPR